MKGGCSNLEHCLTRVVLNGLMNKLYITLIYTCKEMRCRARIVSW